MPTSAAPLRATTLLAVMAGCGRIGYDTVDAEVYSSCVEVRDTRVDATDGFYLLDSGNGAPVSAYCDLTTDGGGWMRVTRDLIDEERSLSVTVVKADDEVGGLVLRVYANVMGCAGPTDNVHLVTFSDRWPWRQIRARYRFTGGTSCWWIFGSVSPDASAQIDGQPIATNLVPFEAGVDTLREHVRMGGAAGDAFDGMTMRCDNETTNFWHDMQGPTERSAVVVLRRDIQPGAAGLATTTSCTDFGPGTSSPTWWEYSEISVR